MTHGGANRNQGRHHIYKKSTKAATRIAQLLDDRVPGNKAKYYRDAIEAAAIRDGIVTREELEAEK